MNLPVPTILDHKGKSYRLAPLGLADLIEFAAWIRDEHMAEAKRQMVGLPEQVANHAYDEARKEAKLIQLGRQEYTDKALSFEGLAHAFWLSARKDDPTISKSTVSEIFVEKMEDAWAKAENVLGFFRSDPIQPVAPAT